MDDYREVNTMNTLTKGSEWKNDYGIQPIMIIPTTELKFGIKRPQSWWDDHPIHRRRYEELRESIKNEGLKTPLQVYNGTFDGTKGLFVHIGNQRLKALIELGITEAPCVWCDTKGHNGTHHDIL